MSPRILLDTHVLLWIVTGAPVPPEVILAVHAAQLEHSIYLSPISAWELGAGIGTKNPARRPDLNDLSPDVWFASAVEALDAQVLPMGLEVALEAARVPAIYGAADPGDCFLIATARVQGLTLVTHDTQILALAARESTYLSVLPC